MVKKFLNALFVVVLMVWIVGVLVGVLWSGHWQYPDLITAELVTAGVVLFVLVPVMIVMRSDIEEEHKRRAINLADQLKDLRKESRAHEHFIQEFIDRDRVDAVLEKLAREYREVFDDARQTVKVPPSGDAPEHKVLVTTALRKFEIAGDLASEHGFLVRRLEEYFKEV